MSAEQAAQPDATSRLSDDECINRTLMAQAALQGPEKDACAEDVRDMALMLVIAAARQCGMTSVQLAEFVRAWMAIKEERPSP